MAATPEKTPYRTRLLAALAALALCALAALLLIATVEDVASHSRRFFGLWRTRHIVFALALITLALLFISAAVSRRMLFGALAALVSLATTGVALELVGLAGIVRWPAVFAPRELVIGRKPEANTRVSGTSSQDTATAWGLPSEPMPFEYVTDRRGYRNQPDRADAEVYLLGDSMLVAALVPFERTLVARLEALLGAPTVQVALIAISPQEAIARFRETKLDPRGRLILQFILEGNDLLDSFIYRNARLPSAQRATRSFWERTLLKQLEVRLLQLLSPRVDPVAAKRSCAINGQQYTFFWVRDSFAGFEGEEAHIEAALELFAGEVRSAGGTFAVVFVPSKFRVLGPLCTWPPGSDLIDLSANLSPFRDGIVAWSARSGVPVLDLTQALSGVARTGAIPWLWGDTHWNADGHAAAARAIAAWDVVRRARSNASAVARD